MVGKVMDGRTPAEAIRSKIREKINQIQNSGVTPNLVTILVGDNPASRTYLRNKHKACADVGIKSRNIELPSTTSQKQLEGTIDGLNRDEAVTGILLQLPLPPGLNESNAVSRIFPEKDVDGLHPKNLGLLMQNAADIVPCTPLGIVALMNYYGVPMSGRHCVIVNRSKLVGRPLSQLLLNSDATVTVCHSKTSGLEDICKSADILITGIGRRSQFTVDARMIGRGSVVVDVGISSVGDKIMGDVDFDSALQIAKFVTPVPGGVGPMTIAMLLYNTVLASCLQKNIEFKLDLKELTHA